MLPRKTFWVVLSFVVLSAFSVPIVEVEDEAATVKSSAVSQTTDMMSTQNKMSSAMAETTMAQTTGAQTTMAQTTMAMSTQNHMSTASNTTVNGMTSESSNMTMNPSMSTTQSNMTMVPTVTTEQSNMTMVPFVDTTMNSNMTMPAEVSTAGMMTSHKPTPKPTPKPTTHKSPSTQKSKFQGGTFVGGIFLGIGITVIIAGIVYYLKFHKSSSYHKGDVQYIAT